MTDNKQQQEAQQELQLGDIYYYGEEGTKVDKEQAFEHYLNAAKLGSSQAAHYVSDMYEDADGVDKNEEESLKWLTESAQAGYTPAQYDLGVHYYNSDDFQNALTWFYYANLNGDKSAKKEIREILNDHPEIIVSILVQNDELKTKIKKLEKKVKKLDKSDD